MSLDAIVQVSISTQASAVSRAGFGVPLILDYHTRWDDRVREYGSAQALLDDGFTVDDFAYKAAAAIFSQSPRPPTVLVGRRSNAPTMACEVHPLAAVEGAVYTVEINGTEFSVTAQAGDGIPDIVTDLVAAINGGAEPVTATAEGGAGTETHLTLEADAAGVPFALYVTDDASGRNIGALDVTADAGIVDDLTAVSGVRDDWYGVVPTSQGAPEILALAAHVETLRRICLVTTQDYDVLAPAVSDDVASDLKAAGYARTVLLWSGRPFQFGAGAWFGAMAPKAPGSATWAYQTLRGVTADSLTATERSAAEAKRANVYVTLGGINVTREGITPAGEYVDVTRGVDWLHARLQERIFSRLANADKVPFTDGGIGIVESEIRAQLRDGITAGLLAADPAPTVTVPKAADVSANDRAARLLSGVTFQAQLAGAIHELTISGEVTA